MSKWILEDMKVLLGINNLHKQANWLLRSYSHIISWSVVESDLKVAN